MSILVTGSTGKIGSKVVTQLVQQGFAVRALTRSPEKAQFPQGVTPVKGDLLDADAMRAALQGVSTLFLLVPNDADELTQAHGGQLSATSQPGQGTQVTLTLPLA